MHPFNQEPKKNKRDPGSATSRTSAEAPHYEYRSLAGFFGRNKSAHVEQ